MFLTSPLFVYSVIALWCFGTTRRITMLDKFGKETQTVDYLHALISACMLVIPASYYACTGQLFNFLAGFAFAWVTSWIGLFPVGIILVSHVQKNPLTTHAISIYSILMACPITMTVFALGLYLGNPFVIGAAFAIASSWVGYIVFLES